MTEPTDEVIIDGNVFNRSDLPDILDRHMRALHEAEQREKQHWIEHPGEQGENEPVQDLENSVQNSEPTVAVPVSLIEELRDGRKDGQPSSAAWQIAQLLPKPPAPRLRVVDLDDANGAYRENTIGAYLDSLEAQPDALETVLAAIDRLPRDRDGYISRPQAKQYITAALTEGDTK